MSGAAPVGGLGLCGLGLALGSGAGCPQGIGLAQLGHGLLQGLTLLVAAGRTFKTQHHIQGQAQLQGEGLARQNQAGLALAVGVGSRPDPAQ
ncbi:MAG: hypothetical protein EBV20_09835 [Betaproteobacteria bacterium]|nr:hypothetical protein [Betaproteobacteria bacterium]